MNLKQRLVAVPYLLFTIVCFTGYAQPSKLIRYSDKHLQYMGRIKMNADNAELYYSGSSVKISFTGSYIKAVLKDEKANNFFEVIVDGNGVKKIKPDTNKTTYTLVNNLTWGKHTIELSKITEYDRGKTLFYDFQIDGSKMYKLKKPERRMEFYGNSITCGFGVEDSVADSGASLYENNFLSYASLTARHYNAQYHCICKSGMGFMVSFSRWTMPEIYNRLNPADSLSEWNFSKYKPHIVVVDIGENDAAIVTRLDNPQFIRVFGKTPPTKEFIINAYVDFIKTLRQKYPNAYIICSLGSMGVVKENSPYPGYVTKAVEITGDKKVASFFFKYKGSAGHPKVKDHRMMADDLIAFIDRTIKW